MRYVVGLTIVLSPLIGLFLIVAGIRGIWTTWKRRPFLRSADGTIVGIKAESVTNDDSSSSELQLSYRPILRFTTERGEVQEFVSQVGKIGSESPYHIGDRVPVLYDRDGVLPPRIDSWFALWGFHVILTGFAGPLFIGCSALLCLALGQRVLYGV
jgi:hypothetical protein